MCKSSALVKIVNRKLSDVILKYSRLKGIGHCHLFLPWTAFLFILSLLLLWYTSVDCMYEYFTLVLWKCMSLKKLEKQPQWWWYRFQLDMLLLYLKRNTLLFCFCIVFYVIHAFFSTTDQSPLFFFLCFSFYILLLALYPLCWYMINSMLSGQN